MSEGIFPLSTNVVEGPLPSEALLQRHAKNASEDLLSKLLTLTHGFCAQEASRSLQTLHLAIRSPARTMASEWSQPRGLNKLQWASGTSPFEIVWNLQ